MFTRFLRWLRPAPAVVVSAQELQKLFTRLDPDAVSRRYEIKTHGRIEIELRSTNAAKLFLLMSQVSDQIEFKQSIKAFAMDSPKLITLDDYLVVDPGMSIILHTYFKLFKQEGVRLANLLAAKSETQEAEYYRVRTQLLVEEIRTLLLTILKI